MIKKNSPSASQFFTDQGLNSKYVDLTNFYKLNNNLKRP